MRNFSSNWQFWFFGPNLPKKVFPVKNRKSEHHHGILHIWISLGTKFQLKLITLSFWTKFTQKRYFQSKTEQAVQWLQAFAFCVVNIKSAVVFKHYEDLKDLIIWTFWKKNWLCLASWALFILKLYEAFQTALCKEPWLVRSWLNFDLNFSFKFLYNFKGQLKKLKLVMVMIKSFDKYHHLFNFPILVTILSFHDWDSSLLNIKVL